MKLVGRVAQLTEAIGLNALGRGAMEFYTRAESILGANMVRQLLDFYSLFYPIAEGYSQRASRTVAMLRDPGITEFRVVTVPFKALRDSRFFIEELGKRKFEIGMLCVNRTWPHAEPETLADPFAAEILEWYGSVSASHLDAIAKLRQTVGTRVREIRVLNELERDVDGLESLERLANELSHGASQGGAK